MSTVVILSTVIVTLSVLLIIAYFRWSDAQRKWKESQKEAEEYLEMAKSNNHLLNEFKDISEDTVNALEDGLDAALKQVEQLKKVAALKEKTNQVLLDSIKENGGILANFDRELSQEREKGQVTLADLAKLQEKHRVLYHNFTFLLNVLAENTPNKPFFARNKLLAAELQSLVYDYTQSTISVGIPDEIIEKAYLQYNGVGGVVIKPRIDAPKVK